MTEYDILLFDVKEFSKQSSYRQLEIKQSLQNCLGTFFKTTGKNYKSVSTGDGYYICLKSNNENYITLLDLISYLISELEDIEIRFALHTGMLEEYEELNKTVSVSGPAFNDLNRFLSGIIRGNIILASRLFYEKFFHGEFVTKKNLGIDRQLVTFGKIIVRDKHGKNHDVYNISYLKDSIQYGLEFKDAESDSTDLDNIDFNDFKKIVEYSFGRKKATFIKRIEQTNPVVHYCYMVLDLTQYTKEYFLFIKNQSIKTQTINHLVNNVEKISEPLTICANKKYLEDDLNEFWKDDLLQKFRVKFPTVKRISFFYIDDFLWENCIPDALKKPILFEEEQNFINPEYKVESGKELKKKTPIEGYLRKFVTNDTAPILLLKGPGGMGKTTLLKRISDLLEKDRHYQKFVFFLDGQNFAKHIYRNEEFQLQKIETLSDLLRFYFTTLPSGSSQYNEAPIILNDELLNIIVSSGNVVIIVDGLDEISGFLKENFSLNTFISDVVSINKLLNHSKILISTRDYYWDNALSKIDRELIRNLTVISLKGFDESMAEEYFSKKFEKSGEKINRGVNILKSLTRSKNINSYYWPFLVYLVSDIVSKEKESESEFSIAAADFESKYLDPNIEFDYIIINFCLRERQRQNLELDVDEFIELFKEIVIEYQGEMDLDSFRDYVSTLLPSITNGTNENQGYMSLLINPLLKEKNMKVTMSIDFIQYHLSTVFLSHFILNSIHSNYVYRILSRYYDGKEDILKDINARLKKGEVQVETFKGYIGKIVSSLRKENLISSERLILQKAISTLLYLAFRQFESRIGMGMGERTRLLVELFNGDLDNVHIYGDFYTFDFSSLTIRNSTFNHCVNFFKSNRDDKTLLVDSKVEASHLFHDVSTTSAWSEKNFDKSCSLSSDLKIILRRTKSHKMADFYSLKKDLISLLNRFQKSGRFIFQYESHLEFPTSSKLTSSQLIHEMQYFDIINKGLGKIKDQWGIADKQKDAVNQLLHNNHVDASFEKIINYIYSKYYT